MKIVIGLATVMLLGGSTVSSAQERAGRGTASPQVRIRYECGENDDGSAMYCDGDVTCGRWGCVCDPGWLCH